jgi:VCBS repeat protein/FG-GAP repeat protein
MNLNLPSVLGFRHRLPVLVCAIAIGALALPVPAHAQVPTTIVGSLSNFDVVNETEGEKQGFEIELEGLHPEDITRVFGKVGTSCYIRYCVGAIVPYAPTVNKPQGGIFVRWTASYNPITHTFATDPVAGNGSSGTPSRVGLTNLPLVTGEKCWTLGAGAAYAASGCEHFGVSTLRNPIQTTYRWLVGNAATGAFSPAAIPPVAIPQPTTALTPPAIPGAAPEVRVQIAGVNPVVIPGPVAIQRRYGTAVWVKVYKTELRRDADLDELVGGHPNHVVEAAKNAGAETEWKLLQFDKVNPTKGSSLLVNHGTPHGGSAAVVRRYEFYKYTGPVEVGQTSGNRPKLSTDGLEKSRCTRDANLECLAPAPGELGDYIGAQMAAQNLGAAVLITQTISGFTLPASLRFGDAPFPLRATGGGSGNPVTFTASGACSVPPNGTVATITGVGTCTVTAAQAGNISFAPAAPVTLSAAVSASGPLPLRLIGDDFDGDGKADVSVFRPSTGNWFILGSLTNATYTWGGGTDIPVAGDYDGDGHTDVAVYRPSTGQWFIVRSSTSASVTYTWGASGDVPVPGDYDGDGKTDIAVFRPSTGVWFIVESSTGRGVTHTWGAVADVPVAGDYDGDGKTDVAVFRPSTGTWYIIRSSTFTSQTYTWGGIGDIPVRGDYDGDGKSDIAVFRPSTGQWFIINSSTFTAATYTWGVSSDIPVPADYDGDGKTDIAVFRPSTGVWYMVNSSTSTSSTRSWGGAGDIPILER